MFPSSVAGHRCFELFLFFFTHAKSPNKRSRVHTAGYKSKTALAANDLKTLPPPPRSPDFNVLHFSLWHSINLAMGKQPSKIGFNKRESFAEFKTCFKTSNNVLQSASVSFSKCNI